MKREPSLHDESLLNNSSESDRTEKIARIIDPEAFAYLGTGTTAEFNLQFRMKEALRKAAAILASVPDQGEAFQPRVKPWMLECFGPTIPFDKTERNHRFLEEALELVQACGCTQSEAHQLVDYVYGRDQGDINQEVGGVMVTLAALCIANGFDMHGAAETELARIWTKVPQIRAKQAGKPKHSPLPGPSDQGEAVAWQWRYVGDTEWLTSSGGKKISDAELKAQGRVYFRQIEQRPLFAAPLVQTPSDMPPTPTEREELLTGDIRWAVNALLESIAVKFEAWDTWDLFRSDAASTVRSFKHDLANVQTPAQVSGDCVLVPREPTEKMIIAGDEANPTEWNDGTDYGFISDVSNDIYRAMIAAAPQGDSGTKSGAK